jgi:tRNA A-37 threonylcarbamoyl transferase component Bud32
MSRKLQQPDADFIALQQALAGEYSLDREIGRGGMGVVYLAREVRLARQVAIKVLPPALAARPDLRDAFLRESQTVAGLNHPNIVPVHASGERDGYVYIVMAFIEGITLGERIRTRGPLLPGQAARLLREVAWALAYAHGKGIVHRDVTAENIVLERGTDRAIVMDFGIASAMQSSAMSDDGRVMGNAHYVSPEQAVGEPLDGRSDLYSLGVSGYYSLTGRLPFDAPTPEEIVTLHLTMPAPPVSRFAHTAPSRLAQAVDRCLAKDPDSRYRTAEAFAEAIDLAFEHAKEIPIALRVWIQQGEKESAPRAMLILWGGVLGSLIAVVNMSPWLFPLTVVGAAAVSFFPVLTRLRRVLKDGYVVDDLHAALREHDLLRSEELQYERRFSLAGLSPALRVMLVASVSSMGALSWLVRHSLSFVGRNVPAADANFFRTTFTFAALFAIGSTVGLAGQFLKQRLAGRIAEMKVNFWKSKWGARLARIAGVGLDVADRPALGVRMLTEVALGRATDHLYQALPKAVRRELSDLPETVRHLEQDATKLRASIDSLDDHLAVFERSTMRRRHEVDHPSNLESELREARALAAERLAATVAALESIRLDLLRLQIGSGGIESVTASLAAAQRVGEQISVAIDSRAEVERLLADPLSRRSEPAASERAEDEDDDADTPVQGVPATRG